MTDPASPTAAHRFPAAPAVSLVAVLAAMLLLAAGCAKVTSDPRNVPTNLPIDTAGELAFDNGATIKVQLLTTAADRQQAPMTMLFEPRSDVAHGLLHAYPPGSRAIFRQEHCDVNTGVAFMDATGLVLEVAPVYATPRYPEQKLDPGMAGFLNQRQIDPELWTAFEKRLSFAGVVNTLMPDVRFALQARPEFFNNNIRVGSRATIPENFLTAANTADDVLPVVDFRYSVKTNDQDIERVAKFKVRMATTPRARQTFLSASSIENLAEDELVVFAWPEERPIAFDARGLDVPVFLVPFSFGADSAIPVQVSGELIELRPQVPVASGDGDTSPINSEPGSRGWEDRWFYRNWEYRSQQAYNGFVLLRGYAIYRLGLEESLSVVGGFETNFSMLTPQWMRNAAVLPENGLHAVRLVAEGQDPIAANLKLLTTHNDRIRGLANLGVLPAAAEDGPGDGGDAVEPPVFDPTIERVDPVPQGYLLAFHRHRSRPLATAGLQPPYDIGVFDERFQLSRVVRVRSADDVPGEAEFSEERFRYLMLMPGGWFVQNGLQKPDGDVLPKTRLELPPTVTRTLAEPARYGIEIDGQPVEVEVVNTSAWRARGLMWRRQLVPGTGMLFVYPEPEMHSFWMLNCFIDLSIAYIDAERRVTDPIITMLHPLLPQDTQIDPLEDGRVRPRTMDQIRAQSQEFHTAGAEAPLALEMDRGWFAANGITPGATIEPGPAVAEFIRRAEGDDAAN